MDRPRLGPFLLDRPIGSGGMGAVWSAIHEEQEVPVAVKVLSARVAREPELRAAFRNEVRAVAALHHANIVLVLDHGEVSREASRASDGQIPAGSPYLVMEFATEGSLHPLRGRLPWARVREVLLQLLDALAHAHARGVIHRDLKPANVLLSGRRQRVKLTDFGLAHLTLKDGHTAPLDAGTPPYMAPEQLQESWRDYGPWTDLYALGNVAAALVAGRPPLADLPVAQVYMKALTGQLPEVTPIIEVPDGFAEWLGRLLATDPGSRYQRAADAAWALGQLEDVAGRAPSAPVPESADAPTVILSETTSRTSLRGQGDAGVLSFERGASPERAERPPLPVDWRSDAVDAPSLRVLGAGLGLYGLRTVPFVGRLPARDALWEAVRAVDRVDRPLVRAVRGPAGVGASRLIRWIGHRAHELGAATVLWAHHEPGAGPHHGLAPMLERHHALGGLDDDAARARLAAAAPDADRLELDALIEYIRPSAKGSAESSVVQSRFAVLAQHLRRLSVDPSGVERSVILVLEDVHHEPETLDFLRWLVTVERQLHVLALVTAAEHADLDELKGLDAVDLLDLGPLGAGETERLVHELLGLERTLATRVVEHVGGVPLYAVELLGSWVERGWLVPGPSGFVLHDDADPVLADAASVGPEALRQLLEQLDPALVEAIERGACLGRSIAWVEWKAACATTGLPARRDAIEALVERRHARMDDDGWSFTHEALRRAVLDRADQAGRTEEHHRACAEALQACWPRGTRGVDRRAALHFELAGDSDRAWVCWERAVPQARVFEAASVVEEVVDRAQRCLDRLGEPTNGARRLRLRIHRAEHLRSIAAYEESLAEAWAVETLAENPALKAEAVASQGHTARQRGDLPTARELLQRAIELFAEARRARGLVNGLVMLAIVERRLGAVDASMDLLSRASEVYKRLDDPLGVAKLEAELGNAWTARGRLDSARPHYEKSRELYEKAGSREGLAYVLNSLGWIAMRDGDPVTSRAMLERSAELYRQLESPQAVIPEANLAHVDLEAGDVVGARARFEAALARYEQLDWRIYAASAHLELLVPVGLLGDWDTWDVHFEAGSTGIRALATAEDEIGVLLEKAARIAREAGQIDRARRTLELAAEQWRDLGRPLRVLSVQRAIEALT